MKHLIAFITISLLVGCSVDNSDSVSHSYTEEQVGAYGVTLEAGSNNMWVSFPEIVSIYESTMTCLGMTADGPTVTFKSTNAWLGEGFNAWGYYMANGKLVIVNTDEQKGVGFPDRNKDIDTQVLKHEFIHHILYMNGEPHGDSQSPEMFARCGQGVNVNN